jgi:hypothetical protein
LGLLWEDKAAQDDIVVSGSDIYMVKGSQWTYYQFKGRGA